jgi:hypothetical protein
VPYKPGPPGSQYRRRAVNLAKLGFASYAAYLRSDLWRKIRMRVLAKHRHVCKRCKGRATQVHHRKYVMKAMTGENLGLLIPLCGPCHEFCEWDGNRKTMPGGANGRVETRKVEPENP